MNDEAVQRELEAILRADGRGEVRDADEARGLEAADADELRAAVMQHVIALATESSSAVRLRVVDVDGIYHLVVHPGGEIVEAGEFEPLGPGDDELWTDAAADDHDVANDEPMDEPIDGDFPVPVDGANGRSPGLGARAQQRQAERAAAQHSPDGGYSAMFGLDESETETDDTDAADVHETAQLPRPGMMRDEPPAVTGMHPIIPPSGVGRSLPGFGAGSEEAAESAEADVREDADGAFDDEFDDEFGDDEAGVTPGGDEHVHEWGDNRYTALHEDAATADVREDATPLARDAAWHGISQPTTDRAVPQFGDGAEPDDDTVVADWGTGGIDTVTGPVTARREDAAGREATADRTTEAEAARPVPASPTDPDASPGTAGAGQVPEWSPRFPRSPQGADGWNNAVPSDASDAPSAQNAHSAQGDWRAPAGTPPVPQSGQQQGGQLPVWAAPAGWGDQAPAADAHVTQAGASRNEHVDAQGASQQATAGGQGPTLDDFLADNATRKPTPATRGWRAGLRRTTGGLVTLGPGSRERAERDEIASVQRTFDGPKTIVVVNPKGGAHKTTTTLMIAAMFGMMRGGYTLAWDNNETRGTLGWRSHRAAHNRTAVDLLRQLSHFEISGGATIADVDRFVRNQGEAKFDVLASDDDAASAAIIDAEAFWRLHRTLSRFYRVLVIDTGNNMRASNWEAALDIADQLVIVSTAREDTAASAAWLADGLRERGHIEKLQNAVTILSSPSAKEDPQLTARLRDHFAQLTRAVVEVPYDEEFVGGGELDVANLRPDTRAAWRHAAAVIAQRL